MTPDELHAMLAMPEPRFWYDHASQKCSGMAPLGDGPHELLFDARDMRAYALAHVLAERERCAKACEEIDDQAWALWKLLADPTEQGRSIGAGHCAQAIRGAA
jgi:hypothetical protein